MNLLRQVFFWWAEVDEKRASIFAVQLAAEQK